MVGWRTRRRLGRLHDRPVRDGVRRGRDQRKDREKAKELPADKAQVRKNEGNAAPSGPQADGFGKSHVTRLGPTAGPTQILSSEKYSQYAAPAPKSSAGTLPAVPRASRPRRRKAPESRTENCQLNTAH